MRKIILLAILCFYVSILNAQTNTFDLSTYKLPDIKRHYLDLNLDLNANNYKYDQYQRIGSDYYRKTNNIGGNAGLGYGFYRNKDSYQGSQYYSIGFGSSYRDEKDEDNLLEEASSFSGSFSLYSGNRFYLNKRFFLETNLSYGGDYSKVNQNEDSDKQKTIGRINDLEIELGTGYGRIEEVQDAWLATYILNELKENDKLLRELTQDEIIEFSSLISQLKNERFFDARLQKIKEIEKVDEFLQSKGLIKEVDSRYFTVINDNWDNAAIQPRSSGRRLSFDIIPGIVSNYYYRKNTEETETRNTEYYIGANLSYSSEKPIDLNWQSSFYVSLSANYLKGIYEYISDGTETEIISPQLNSTISYSIKYYPNSRTDLSLNFYLDYENCFGTEEVNEEKNNINYFRIYPYSNFNLNYYISPQLRLEAYYRVSYYYIESNSDYYFNVDYNNFIQAERFYQYLNVGFVYKIF